MGGIDFWIRLIVLAISKTARLIRERRSRAAQSWPMVEGTVESTMVREGEFGQDQGLVAEVQYSYSVGGAFYSGAHEVKSEREFESFPKLSRVVVHYKPSDPSVSFLDREDVRLRGERMMA